MSAIFNDYPETINNTPSINDSVEKTLFEDDVKLDLKKIKKQNKKINKLSKKILKNFKKRKTKDTAEKKSFLQKMGDVFLQAFPALLTTAVSVAVKVIFGGGFKSHYHQRQVMA